MSATDAAARRALRATERAHLPDLRSHRRAQPMTDAQVARAAASWIVANRWRVMGRAVGYVHVDGSAGITRADDPLLGMDVFMRAPLVGGTPEVDSLAQALLASVGS